MNRASDSEVSGIAGVLNCRPNSGFTYIVSIGDRYDFGFPEYLKSRVVELVIRLMIAETMNPARRDVLCVPYYHRTLMITPLIGASWPDTLGRFPNRCGPGN